MFLTLGSWGHTWRRGSFLVLFNKVPGGEVRALVRYTTLRQSGNFMAGIVKVKSPAAKAENDTVPEFDKQSNPDFHRVGDGYYNIHLSGTYGSDGLPRDADHYPGLWEQLHPLPKELEKAFWDGGGWNSSGKEGPSMYTWAKENRKNLSRLAKPKPDEDKEG